VSENEPKRSGADLARSLLAAARKSAKAGTSKNPVKGRKTKPTRSSRDPATFSDAISGLVAERGWSQEMSVGSLFGKWPALVGPELAEHVKPVAFEGGELTLKSDSTAWATEVRLLSGELIARLNTELGTNLVEQITVKGPTGPSWRKGPRSVKGGRGPRDTYG